MRRVFAGILLIGIFLSGCGILENHLSDPVTFYYLQKQYTYGQTGSVIVAEPRESSGHRSDLSYMMALYLMGPTEEEHITPIPPGTRIFCTLQDNGDIQLQLSEAANSLSDTEFSLACACLSLTCFDITDTDKVTIINGERTIAMSRNNLTLSDDSASYPVTEETQ